MPILDRVVTAIGNRPAPALGAAVAVVGALAWPAGSVRTDNGLAVWFVQDDPALAEYHRFLDTFGNDEAVVVAWARDGGSPGLDPSELELVERTAAAVGAVEGVEGVLSPAPLIRLAGAEAAWPMLKELGLVGDGAVALVARMAADPGMDARRGGVLDGIAGALDTTVVAAGHAVHTAGTGVLYEGLNRETESDGRRFLGLALAVMAVLLWWILGSLRAVLLALAPPLAATLATTGLVAWTGGSLNVVMATLPALILVIGVADGVHILLEWFRARRASAPAGPDERRRLAAEVVGAMALPCLYTSVTTALAFLALLSSRMAVLRELGVYAAAGILLVWGLAIVVSAAGLSVMDVPLPPRAPGARLSRVLGRLGGWLAARRWRVAAGFAVATAALAAGASRITVDTHTLGLLPDTHPVVADSRWIEARLGPYTPLEFVVEPRAGSVLEPRLLTRLAAWERAAGSLGFVGRVLGPTDVIASVGGGLPASAAEAESAVAAYRALTGDDLGAYLTPDRRAARVTAYVPMGTARDFGRWGARLDSLATTIVGDAAAITPTGYLPLYVRIVDYTVSSALAGLALAFAGVFLVLGLVLRSWRPVAASIPPNLFPVAAVFGVMGWAGIPLDIATATVGAIILGIAVDDTVHFLHRHREARLEGSPVPVRRALERAGPGMVLTSVVLVLGLGVLLAAGTRSIFYFGLLITLAVAAALAGDLLLLPALVAGREGE